jgi:hypothetical protein
MISAGAAETFAEKNLLAARLVARLSEPLLNGKRLGIFIPAAKLPAEEWAEAEVS